jgi:hypothetical protein
MNAIAELFRLPETKSQRETFVAACVSEIKSGIHNPLNIDIQLKNLEETIKAIREQVKEDILAELAKYPDKTFEYNGVTFTKKNAVSYDYSNDSVWSSLKETIKAREALLKNVTTPIADAETGEMIEPAIKKSTETYSITFNK